MTGSNKGGDLDDDERSFRDVESGTPHHLTLSVDIHPSTYSGTLATATATRAPPPMRSWMMAGADC